VLNLPMPLFLPGSVHNLNVFTVQGVPWVAYHADADIVAHPFHELRGYRFPAGFYLHVRETSIGVVLATAKGAGDTPVDRYVLDPSAPRVELLAPRPEPKPEPKPEPTPEPQPMPDRDAPNPGVHVEKIRAAFMDEWVAMNDHRELPDFNTRVASYLHHGYAPLGIPGDPRWGLNGKRGGDEVSPDVLNYANSDAPFGTETYDYVISHGAGAAATVGWIDVTDPNGAGAKWIQPPHPSALVGSVDPGEPDPVKPPPIRDEFVHVQTWLTEAGLSILRAQRALVDVKLPEAKPCELPHNPVCDRPHGDRQHPSYDDMMRLMGETGLSTQCAHIVWRFLIEGYSHQDLVKEVGR
jgi:hypothetical protein